MGQIIELGDKIEVIRKTGFKSKQRPFYSKIQEILENDQIIISAPIENGRIIPLEMDYEYYVCIYTSHGLYRCEAAVVSRSHEDNQFLATLEFKNKLQKYQRRQYYRLDCMLAFQYKNNKDSEEWNKGTILDISGGGIRFTSKNQLVPQEVVACRIQLNYDDDRQFITIDGSVLTSSITDFRTNIYETRLVFENISNDARENIIRFIFEEERKRRKKEKGMR